MSDRRRGFVLCSLAYLLALGAAVAVGLWLRGEHPLLLLGAADLAGTLVVFIFSVALDNSSFYDPYWSVAPVPIAAYHLATSPAPASWRGLAVLALVVVYSVRLTHNWARSWRGVADEDWRYVQIRRRCGRAYWPVSLLGIHLMPTAMVFLGCLPLWPALTARRGVGWLDGVALLVTVGAIWIEAAADLQLHRFKAAGPEGVLNTGLWATSRHPNYFGEIVFWWGLFLFGLAAGGGRGYWTGAGAVAITLLFLFVSLPLIERRMVERRPGYREEQRRRSLLVPWFPRR